MPRARRCRDDGETVGEIVVRGNVVMAGYYNDPGNSDRRCGAAGFIPGTQRWSIRTATLRSATVLKDVIISGGENISSVEVEGVLIRHPYNPPRSPS